MLCRCFARFAGDHSVGYVRYRKVHPRELAEVLPRSRIVSTGRVGLRIEDPQPQVAPSMGQWRIARKIRTMYLSSD